MNNAITLKDSVTFALRQGSLKKKIFKLAFVKERADFYVAFPYLKINSYRCGTISSRQVDVPQTFNTLDKNTNISTVPVKFSYHESGQVHFKPQGPTSPAISPSLKLAEIKTTPINLLRGNHIFTILVEGFQHFEDISSKDENKKSVVFIDVSPGYEHLKVVGYAGYSETQIGYKYRSVSGIYLPPNVTVNFTRPHLPGILRLGIYLMPGDSIVTELENRGKPYILSLVGFKTTGNLKQALFLHASIPGQSKDTSP